MQEKQLYAKTSKVEYLGHIVSHEGVKVDPNKIKAIKKWKVPTTIKQLQGFLGLIGCYRNIFQNWGRMEAPLSTLLKKYVFSWIHEETKAFENIKEAMCLTLVLATPDFTKTFFVECDAS